MSLKTVRREYRSQLEKAARMVTIAEASLTHPRVIELASRFAHIADDRQRADAILFYVQFAIAYENDPGIEILDSPEVTILRGIGDCDAKTMLLYALMKLNRIRVFLFPQFIKARFPHVRDVIELEGHFYVADGTIQNSNLEHLPRRAITNYWEAAA